MEIVKKHFSIKDLENLSGIKAHTIRIWEKRYHLLSPLRTGSNIRYYDLCSLQKLLNVTLLYEKGFKISKIAKMSSDEVIDTVKSFIVKNEAEGHTLSQFKLSMLNFDQRLFLETYTSLSTTKTFSEIFKDVFIPLLNEIGLLWQTDTITPSHEHFITNLIKQKIYMNIENLQKVAPSKKDKIYVLYLPENEIHELGLLFVNYVILKAGYHTIYLGQSVPLENLIDLIHFYDHITFVSYFTTSPSKDNLDSYITQYNKEIGKELILLGYQASLLNKEELPPNVKVFNSIKNIIDIL